MTMYIGMDVHCKQSVYVAQDPSGNVIGQGSVPTTIDGLTEMLSSLHAPEKTRIGLETGVQTYWVARLLSTLGMEPVVIDAREVRQKARRKGQKSDRRDAFEICDGLRRGFYSTRVYVPSPEIQGLRRILSRRRHFVRLCTSQVNAAKFLLRSVGLSSHASWLRSWAAWQELLDRPALASLRDHLAMHARLWREADKNVRALEKELGRALKGFSETAERLQGVMGVGPITAATYIAVLGIPDRFPDSSHVVSYIGLVPSTYDSGETVRRGHITKRGSAELRTMLCEAAQHARNPRHPLNPYFVRICAKGGYKKAVVAVAQRLGRILFAMWKNGEDFNEDKLNVVSEKAVKSRITYYRIRRPDEKVMMA